MNKTVVDVLPDLRSFVGTMTYLRHRIIPGGPSILLTDGAKYVAEKAQAWWLMDKVLTHTPRAMRDGAGFATIKLTAVDGSATFAIEDGNYNQILNERIEFTDFPTGTVEFFLEGRGGGEPVLMLTSEY